jgi:hypothetical protein
MEKLIFKTSNFRKRTISVQRAVRVLSKNKIQVNEAEAAVILDFLYHIAKTYKPESPDILK